MVAGGGGGGGERGTNLNELDIFMEIFPAVFTDLR